MFSFFWCLLELASIASQISRTRQYIDVDSLRSLLYNRTQTVVIMNSKLSGSKRKTKTSKTLELC